MYVWHGADTVKRKDGSHAVYRHMTIPKACQILGIRDREYREGDLEFLREAFSKRVSIETPPTEAIDRKESKLRDRDAYHLRVKHFYKNHMRIHEAYQYLHKRKTAEIEQARAEALQAQLESQATLTQPLPLVNKEEVISSYDHENGINCEEEEDTQDANEGKRDFIMELIQRELSALTATPVKGEDEHVRPDKAAMPTSNVKRGFAITSTMESTSRGPIAVDSLVQDVKSSSSEHDEESAEASQGEKENGQKEVEEVQVPKETEKSPQTRLKKRRSKRKLKRQKKKY